MDTERILFTVSRMEDGVRVKTDMNGPEDMFDVCICLCDLLRRNIQFAAMFQVVLDEQTNNEDYVKTLEDNTIELPDFNQLLKNIKDA